MLRRSGVGRMLALKTKLNSNSAGRSEGKKYKTLLWYRQDILPHTGWSIVKLLSKASNCQVVSGTTWGVCEMKPDTSENSLNDWETERAYFINRWPCSASNPNVTAVGREASSPKPPLTQQLSPRGAQTCSEQAESRAGGWSGLSLLIRQWGDQVLCKFLFSCAAPYVWRHAPPTQQFLAWCCQQLTHICSLTLFHPAFCALG